MNKEDPVLRFYAEEMRYLKNAGAEFARAHPDRAALLNIDNVGDRDPYVERLFEGFAFLTGRIQQKLNDDLPELTEGLVGLLWPHYLRMIPSLIILKIDPVKFSLQRNSLLEKGITVSSLPIVAEEGSIKCVYRTTSPINLMPIEIKDIKGGFTNIGHPKLIISIQIEKQAKKEMLDLSKIRLYLAGDVHNSFALRHALLNKVKSVKLKVADKTVACSPTFSSVGFEIENRLWPKAQNSFEGYQLLLEYFVFKQKFLFIDLNGISIKDIEVNENEFQVEVEFEDVDWESVNISKQSMQLFCSPAINLFEIEAEPLIASHCDIEYQVRPLLHHGLSVEAYSVEEVHAFSHKDGNRYEYVPFSSFKHRGGMLKYEAPERYFHSRVKKGVRGEHEMWISLGGNIWSRNNELPEETLSLKVIGTNGNMPRKILRETHIYDDDIDNPNIACIRNLTTPTMSCYPPLGDRFQWRLLSHLAPNYLSLLNKDMLKSTLAIYDWTDDELNKRKLEGILDVTHCVVSRVEQGCIHRGVHIKVFVDSKAFSNDAELYFFGELLNRFFEMYAEINLFVRFEMVSLPVGKSYKWKDSKTTIASF